MKTQCAFKFTNSLLVLFIFISSYDVTAQSFNLNDPNIVYKDKDGNLMSKDSVLSFVSKGTFGMIKKDIGDGKIEVRLFRQTKTESEERSRVKKEWVNKWINKPFPDFNVSTLTGNSMTSSDFNGKVVVLNFWFTGCQPCIAEMPRLTKLVNDFKDQPVIFLAFTFNDKEAIRKFILKHDFQYIQLPGAQDLIEKLKIDTYPTHMVLDKKGIIREIEIGAADDIDEKLKVLIENVKNLN